MRKYYIYLLCIVFIFIATACTKKDDIPVTPAEDVSAAPTEGEKVTLTPIITATLAPTATPAPTIDPEVLKKEENSKYTIVIDAGHQTHHNADKEPIGPGAKETKAKVSSGTQGRFTNIPEYKVNLEVSLRLRDLLEEQGYQVVMVREKNDVNISNSERAAIANENHADAFIRIHCNGSEDPEVNGILTICPTKNNPYCSEIYGDSKKLSVSILNSLCEKTGAKDAGVMETDTMSGINWSEVPVTIVEMGYMTNEKEDNKVTDSDYQDLLAEGIAEGVEEYLKQ